MPWATAVECADVTGSTPDDATLALAHASIRSHINRTEVEVTAVATDRDLEWLRDAVAWQAAWLPSQPGYLARMGADSVSQDGLSVKHNSAADQLLAPLAQRALKNLSWMGSRSLRTKPRAARSEGEMQSASSFLTHDPEEGWVPL
jgi:hypothetical protein